LPAPGGHIVVYGQGSQNYSVFIQGPKYLSIICDPQQGYVYGENWYNYGETADLYAGQYSGWYFDHWVIDGNQQIWANPLPLTMASDHTVQAVYTNTPAYYWLNINAHGYYPVDAQIWVDNNYVGTQTASVYVTQGMHTITVEDPAYCPETSNYIYFWVFFSQEFSGYNGYSFYICGDTDVDAVYFG
jgi:hypothetical protein